MTEPDATPPPGSAPEILAGAEDDKPPRSFAPLFAKGCGFVVLCSVLGLGVAFGGHAKLESWGSAVMGVFFLLLVVSTSGLTGWWNK